MARSITLNARFYSHDSSPVSGGMRRYGMEMAARMKDLLKVVKPGGMLNGIEGHLWEQMYLPAASGKGLLWSPSNTGPLSVSRQVCTIHDIGPIEHPEWFPAGVSKWYRWLLPKLVTRVQHIITVSEFTKSRLVDYFQVKPEKISVIPNGVEEIFRPRGANEIERMRFEMGIQSPRYVLSVGAEHPRGNLGRLLAAWERLLPELPGDVELLVTGAKTAVNIPDRVRFAGPVKQEYMPALYSGALALVYPSLYEGFGLPVLEAMASGCTVVTSNTTALPEVVGDAGLLVDPNDEDSIADAVFRIIVRPQLRDELARKAFSRAERMTWDATAAETRALLVEQSKG